MKNKNTCIKREIIQNKIKQLYQIFNLESKVQLISFLYQDFLHISCLESLSAFRHSISLQKWNTIYPVNIIIANQSSILYAATYLCTIMYLQFIVYLLLVSFAAAIRYDLQYPSIYLSSHFSFVSINFTNHPPCLSALSYLSYMPHLQLDLSIGCNFHCTYQYCLIGYPLGG